jgi:hypothetical protein
VQIYESTPQERIQKVTKNYSFPEYEGSGMCCRARIDDEPDFFREGKYHIGLSFTIDSEDENFCIYWVPKERIPPKDEPGLSKLQTFLRVPTMGKYGFCGVYSAALDPEVLCHLPGLDYFGQRGRGGMSNESPVWQLLADRFSLNIHLLYIYAARSNPLIPWWEERKVWRCSLNPHPFDIYIGIAPGSTTDHATAMIPVSDTGHVSEPYLTLYERLMSRSFLSSSSGYFNP